MYATFDLVLAFVADIAITVSTALMRSMVRLRLANDPTVTEEVSHILSSRLACSETHALLMVNAGYPEELGKPRLCTIAPERTEK